MLDFSNRRLLLRAFVSAVVGLFLIALDPFGIERRSDEASNDMFLHVIAPLVSARQSPYPITVVLVTPQSLARLNKLEPKGKKRWTWPFDFAQQARIFDVIAGDEPRAVFYDIAFYQDRNAVPAGTAAGAAAAENPFAASIGEATNIGRKASDKCLPRAAADPVPGLPVFLAVVPNARTVPELCAAGAEGVRVEWDAHYNSYPLDARAVRDVAGNSMTDGKPFLTPAARLFEEVCGKDSAGRLTGCPAGAVQLPSPSPLGMIWATGIDPAQGEFANTDQCEQAEGSGFMRAVHAFFGDLTARGEGPRALCAYPLVIPIDQVLRPFDTGNLSRALKAKVVMIGTTLPGINDIVTSAAHGQVPAVFAHAAALDNLLRWGGGYVRDIEDDETAMWILRIVSGVIVTAMIFATVSAIEWFRRNPPSLPVLAYCNRRPGRRLIVDALVDLLQLAALFLAICLVLLLLTLMVFFGFGIAPQNWLGMAALVMVLTLDEITGTARDAIVVLLMTFKPARLLARKFFAAPSMEE